MIEIIDSTRLKDSLRCLRLYYWRHERGFVPAQPRLPLVYGSAIHACLAKHYENQPAGVCLAAFEEIWSTEVLPHQMTTLEAEDPKRNPLIWAEIFMLYKRHYHVEPFTVRTVETPFLLPLTNDLALGGVIDMVIEYLGQTMIVDHKTTSYLNYKWFSSFNPNHQFSAYLLAANELIKPINPITTMMVNCILVSKAVLTPEKMFDRPYTTRTPNQLAAFKENIIAWWQVVRACRQANAWPQNTESCSAYNGCEYHDLCIDVMYDYRQLIPSRAAYRHQIWNPIENLEKHGLKEATK